MYKGRNLFAYMVHMLVKRPTSGHKSPCAHSALIVFITGNRLSLIGKADSVCKTTAWEISCRVSAFESYIWLADDLYRTCFPLWKIPVTKGSFILQHMCGYLFCAGCLRKLNSFCIIAPQHISFYASGFQSALYTQNNARRGWSLCCSTLVQKVAATGRCSQLKYLKFMCQVTTSIWIFLNIHYVGIY